MPLEDRTYNLTEIYDYLKRFRLGDSLFILSLINATFKFNFNTLYKDNIPPQVAVWIETLLPNPMDRLALFLNATKLARLLILSPSNDFKKEVLDIGSYELGTSLELVGKLLDLDEDEIPKTPNDLTRILGRLGQSQFPLQRDRLIVLGRAQLLFINIPAKLNLEYDIDAKMREYFNIGVFEFVISGFALWLLTNGVLKFKMDVEVEALKDVVTQDNLNIFIELSSGSYEDYRRNIRGNEWKVSDKKKDLYAHDPFYKMPIIKVEHSLILPDPSLLVPQPFYLLQRASIGIFYLLSDHEREIAALEGHGDKKNQFRDNFGLIYRAYVGMHLEQNQQNLMFIDLDAELPELPDKLKKPDFAIIQNGVCILFEVKTGLLKLSSRVMVDKYEAREEISNGNFKKALKQLDDFEVGIKTGKIADPRFKNIGKVLKIIVGFEDVYLANAFLLPIARELYPGRTETLQIASLTDIEQIGDFIERGGDITGAMIDKVADEEIAEHAIAPFITNRDPKPNKKPALLYKAFQDLMQKATGGKLFSDEGIESADDIKDSFSS